MKERIAISVARITSRQSMHLLNSVETPTAVRLDRYKFDYRSYTQHMAWCIADVFLGRIPLSQFASAQNVLQVSDWGPNSVLLTRAISG